ncbi:hypothetical protein BU16DRAFT_535934 [Lophium mytilinum]|uniref:BTB domain-containing protein n=1 Tax=Lophium mytilinum TaxID=390894 RepID=A0A6A6R5I4_9PEZI|nr:hypothetical protein BU16DRAFT_535934 [Lophium mytilinum]
MFDLSSANSACDLNGVLQSISPKIPVPTIGMSLVIKSPIVTAATPASLQKIEIVPVYIGLDYEYITSASINILSQRCPKFFDYLYHVDENRETPKIHRPELGPDTPQELVNGDIIRLRRESLTSYGVSSLITWLCESTQINQSHPIELGPTISHCIDIFQAFSFFGFNQECEDYGRYIDTSISNAYSHFQLPVEQVQAIWERRNLPGTTRFTNRLVGFLVDHPRQCMILEELLMREGLPFDPMHPSRLLMRDIMAYLSENYELNACVTAAYKRIHRPTLAFCPMNRQVANSAFIEPPKGPTKRLAPACWLGLCTACAEIEEVDCTAREAEPSTWASRARAIWARNAECKKQEAEMVDKMEKLQIDTSNLGFCYM